MGRLLGLLLVIVCMVGCEGKEGPMGQDGALGEQGDRGPAGLPGSTGPQGEQGEKGDGGRQGTQGRTGQQGEQGRTGQQGEQGPPSNVTYVARFNNEDEISTWWKANTGSWRIEEGRLILSGTGVGRQMSVQSQTNFTSDLDISVDTEWLGGVDNADYGILFRSSSKGNYGFGISANGQYIVAEWDFEFENDIAPYQFIDWTASSVINEEGTNTLRIITSGSLFEFYINGVMVNSITDETQTEGSIRLYVSHLQEVAFDNLEGLCCTNQ